MSFLSVVMQWLLLFSLALTVFYLYLITVRHNFNTETNSRRQLLTDDVGDGKFAGVDEYTRYMTSQLKLKPNAGGPAMKPEFGPALNDVDFRYSINPRAMADRCRDTSLFIVVISAPGNFLHRKLIRRTWATHLNGIHYAFLIGSTDRAAIQQDIRNESSTYEDLIQVDMVDTYMNLTLKSVALLHWALHFCPDAPFILKCDDDIYVNTRNLAEVIQQLPAEIPRVYGASVSNLKPLRPKELGTLSEPADDSDKWIIDRRLWPWSTYPTYVSGGCYLIASSAIGQLLAAAQTTPYFPFEDLYVTGLCARKAEVPVLASDLYANTCVVQKILFLNYSAVSKQNAGINCGRIGRPAGRGFRVGGQFRDVGYLLRRRDGRLPPGH